MLRMGNAGGIQVAVGIREFIFRISRACAARVDVEPKKSGLTAGGAGQAPNLRQHQNAGLRLKKFHRSQKAGVLLPAPHGGPGIGAVRKAVGEGLGIAIDQWTHHLSRISAHLYAKFARRTTFLLGPAGAHISFRLAETKKKKQNRGPRAVPSAEGASMSGTRKKIEYHEHDTPEEKDFPDISNVASATECTGLMYRVPIDNEELESYQQLSNMEIPKGKQDMKESVQYKLHHSKNAEEAGRAVEEASGMRSCGEETHEDRTRS